MPPFTLPLADFTILLRLLAIDGGYTPWSEWSACSVTCGEGEQLRARYCTNPAPQHGGKDCSELGQPEETKKCTLDECREFTRARQLGYGHKIVLAVHYSVCCWTHDRGRGGDGNDVCMGVTAMTMAMTMPIGEALTTMIMESGAQRRGGS